jgi:TolB-like protein/cytochrome c-type biogenesis protein CcmH/NrfG
MLRSRAFSGSLRLRSLLKFLVEEAAAGRADGIKEQVLALELYGRGLDFDPANHSVVRVDVRRLRDKIREYYESEGAADRIRIEIPKGSYCPVFVDRHQFTPSPGEPGAQLLSLCVLPFENLSGADDDEYFAAGMTDGLITEIAKVRALRVISRTSVMAFKGTRRTLPEVARELNVTHIVTGAVIKDAGRVRATCQLIRAEPETHLWAERYECDLAGIVDVQSTMARAVLDHFPRAGGTALQAGVVRTINDQAYDAYLRGCHHWNRLTPEDLGKSIEYFHAALAHDPTFAPAHIGLADAYLWLGVQNAISQPEACRKAKAAAERGLAHDPSRPDAWTTLACVAGYAWQWEEAEQSFKRALELNPNSAAAHVWYGSFLAHLGRFEEAIRENRAAHDLDPLSAAVEGEYGMVLVESRRYEEAARHMREMIRTDPRYFLFHFHLGRAYIYQEDFSAAIEALETASQLAPISDCVALLTFAHAKAKLHAKALQLRDKLEQMSRRDRVPAFLMAVAALGFGERDRALDYLEQAYEQREWLMRLIGVEPGFDELRGTDRFIRLVGQLGLPGSS